MKNPEGQWRPNPALVELVAHGVKTLATVEGHQAYPNKDGVELVLRAMYLTNLALKIDKEKNATQDGTVKQNEPQ